MSAGDLQAPQLSEAGGYPVLSRNGKVLVGVSSWSDRSLTQDGDWFSALGEPPLSLHQSR